MTVYSLLHLPTGIVFPLDVDHGQDWIIISGAMPTCIRCQSIFGCPKVFGTSEEIACEDCPLYNLASISGDQFELQVVKK